MVVLLFLLTVLGFITVELILRWREERRAAAESLAHREPAGLLPGWAVRQLPGGLFFHSGHTWAKLQPSGAVQVGLDGFAHGILGRVDRFELPARGAQLRQGEPAFVARKGGKRIEFVSPVDGVVCSVNQEINVDLQGAKTEPYEKGWAFAIRPSNLVQNLKRLRIGTEAPAWLEREVRRFSEFLSLHRAVPQEVGVTLPDGGTHAEGIMETMDGEILQIAIRKFFR
ncbi:MAG: glycine cleavage system protein H [Deltaproteobacteria bacterium]|nr:glycine cleavage system protein H [Deltaproteobacteria bacterium]